MTKFTIEKFQRHAGDRFYQTILLVISQICLSVVRNRIEGYELEKLQLAFHDAEITLLSYDRLHAMMLITCALLMVMNLFGLYWEGKEDPEKAALDAKLRKAITWSSFCLGCFFTFMTTLFGFSLLVFYGFRTRQEFIDDQLEANSLCGENECDSYQDSWVVDYDLIYCVLFINMIALVIEVKKLVLDFWPLIREKPCIKKLRCCSFLQNSRNQGYDEVKVDDLSLVAAHPSMK